MIHTERDILAAELARVRRELAFWAQVGDGLNALQRARQRALEQSQTLLSAALRMEGGGE